MDSAARIRAIKANVAAFVEAMDVALTALQRVGEDLDLLLADPADLDRLDPGDTWAGTASAWPPYGGKAPHGWIGKGGPGYGDYACRYCGVPGPKHGPVPVDAD